MTALVFDVTVTNVTNKTNPAANIPVDWCLGRILANTRATREMRFEVISRACCHLDEVVS